MKIIYLPAFIKRYKKLPAKIKFLSEEKEKLFKNNPKDKKLKVHKLHGELSGLWSFSIDSSYRLVFSFGEHGVVYFHNIGDYDEVY